MKVEREDLEAICTAALAAGEAVSRLHGRTLERWRKNDASLCSEADLQADRVIREGLRRRFPGVFVFSEESLPCQPRTGPCFFLVDPLDGTREFLDSNGEYTVNIALIVGEQPVAAAVYAPAVDELFYAADGCGAFKRSGGREVGIRVRAVEPGAPLRIIGSRSHATAAVEAWLASLQRDYTFVPCGSSLKFCRIAEGLADIYPRLGPTSQWDTAAAQCVLEQAGGQVTDLAGKRLSYGLDRPMLNPMFAAVADAAHLALLKDLRVRADG